MSEEAVVALLDELGGPRRRGRSRASVELIEACHEILVEIQPATVRAVCYRLFTRGLIPDMSKASTNKVSRLLVAAREEAAISWEWIVDETREAERVSAWSSPDEIVRAAVNGYRRDAWVDQPFRVEVWSEKGTVRGTLKPVLEEYGVTFRVMHGFASATAINEIAESSSACPKPLVALYVGDWDPSGLYMSERDLPDRLARYGADVELHRVALTMEDLAAGLPCFDSATKSGDARYRWYVERYPGALGESAWELDAMSPVDLRERVEGEIQLLIDDDAWDHAKRIEKAQIESLQHFHAQWKARLSSERP